MVERRETQEELRVMPNRSSLFIGVVGSGVLLVEFLAQSEYRWIAPFLAIVFLSCSFHILWPTPMVRATKEGLFLGIGSFGRSFLVPWDRVDGVVLTQVPMLEGRGYLRDALGFVIIQDDEFKLPALRWNSASPDAGPPYSDVTFEFSMIDGDVKTWVEKLEEFRKDVRHISA